MTTSVAEPYAGSATDDLAVSCEKLWGEDWAAPLSACTGIALRTCQRVRASAKVETDHPKAEHLLGRLAEVLAVIGVEADVTAGMYDRTMLQVSRRGRRQLTSQYVAHILKAAAPMDEEAGAVGPLLSHDVVALLDEATEIEQALVDIVDDLLDALSNPDQTHTPATLLKVLALGVHALDGVVMLGVNNRPIWLLEGQAAFASDPDPTTEVWDALIMLPGISKGHAELYANALSKTLGHWVEPIKILAEAYDNDVEQWVLAVTAEGDPVTVIFPRKSGRG